ncbi:MAG: tetratricopeptide repeat protein [Candidatus Eisenbacteria bacterium]
MRHVATGPLVRVLVLTLVVAVAFPTATGAKPAEGETPVEGSIQRARQAAAVGAVDEAIEIYMKILEDDHGNERAFWGLVGLYSSAGMEEALIALLERRVSEYPFDTQAKMELGQAHAKTGNHDVAHGLWMEVLGHERADVGQYSDIGALEIRHRMYEQALETFMTGRGAFRSESLFSQELTQIHTALGDFGSAMDECLITVDHHGGAVSWATNRIELMIEEGAGRGDIRAKMAAVAEDREATAAELGLAGSVFLVLDLPERALAAFLRADEISGGQGTELLEYATILSDDGRKDEARDAYLMVVERHPGTSSGAQAGTAAARLMAEAGDPAGAVAELRQVADSFEGSARGAQALFEAAKVELDVLDDPEAALATVAELRGRFGERARRMNDEVTLVEVDAYMKQGRLDEAYERSAGLNRDDVPDDIRESAMFTGGFVSFLKHDYEKAIEEFRVMVEANAASVLVNDALRLMLVIANAQEAGDVEPVDLLADAHAARLAGDAESSRLLLQELAGRNDGEAVKTEALLLLGAAATVAGDPGRAIEYYDSVTASTEGVTARAEAMMRKADILRLTLGRTREASDQYLAILEDLPANTLSGEARRKLDRLRRGEGVEE